jgi:hypothetical protein
LRITDEPAKAFIVPADLASRRMSRWNVRRLRAVACAAMGNRPNSQEQVRMMRNLALMTAAFGTMAGFAMAQTDSATVNADATAAAASKAQAHAYANAKPGETYEWAVDSKTVTVPVHPTVTEKVTTTTNVAPPPLVKHHTSETTTTTTGDQ